MGPDVRFHAPVTWPARSVIRTGRLPESRACLRLALSILEDLDDERCGAYALLGIGQTLLAAGEPVQARGVCDRALRVFRETGNRQGETTGLALLEQAQRRRSPAPARA
jgi:hypothetical protein